MKIKVKITRDENLEYYNNQTEIEIDIEEYLRGVVPAEVGNAHPEAAKAQAVAARTFALRKFKSQGYITDKSSVDQAFRSSRFSSSYQQAHQAVADTKGEVLFYNGSLINNAYYSAANGGRTYSSQEKWGGVRPYLIAQEDPWDLAASGGKRNGHGVGMSQVGAKYAASIGKTYQEILSFYYVGTEIRYNYGDSGNEGSTEMATIKASALVEKCKQPLNEKWGYIWGGRGQVWTAANQAAATREMTVKYGSKWVGKRVVDCSGLLYWAFKELGGYMYHGSNTIWKKYCTNKGNISSTSVIKPGTAVFLVNGSDYHHVGIYIGNDTVIEAKGTQAGVVTSKLSHWDTWGELKGVDYSETSNDYIENVGSIILQSGSSGTLVRELQEGLNELGFNCGEVDGKFGSKTKAALIEFQKSKGLNGTGICDNNTWVALNAALGTEGDSEGDDEEVYEVLYEATVVASSGATVNMRGGKSTSSAILMSIPIKKTVAVLEEGADWCKIEYNNKVGYMMTKFLEKKTAEGNSTKAWYLKVECENESEARAILAAIQKLSKAVAVEK